MASSTTKNANEVKAPHIRLPWERHRLAIFFDPEQGRTHQSFKDECDIERILSSHARTGLVEHLNPGQPQYGEAPESTLFEAAVVQAEIRSALEDGWEPPESAPEDDQQPADPQDGSQDSEPQAASEAAPEQKNGDKGG